MSHQQENDLILMNVLKTMHSHMEFLESIFGFLARNTDFYYLMKNKNDSIGYPPGIKEQMVLKAIKKFEINYPNPIQFSAHDIDDVAAEEIIEYSGSMKIENDDTKQKKNSNLNEKEFKNNDFYNGSKFENYCWSQTTNDLEISVFLPDIIHSSKQLNVQIESNYIKISDKCSETVILEGNLYEKCKNNDAVWSVNKNKLQIQLDKIREIWWKKCFVNEPDIDLKKIDASRSFKDLPEESQIMLEKFKWDQEQKLKGLPTSEDLKHQNILKKAWDTKGSPFKGQPYDPSLVKFE